MPPAEPVLDERLRAAAWLPALGPFGCFGQQWCVRTTDPALHELVDELYAPLRVPGGGAPVVYDVVPPQPAGAGVVARDGAVLREPRGASTVLGYLVWAVNRQVIQQPRQQPLLHAAAAELDGRAVVLPAVMESGKSTLVTGLLDRGWRYLSDEAVMVGADLRVDGYPKPLTIDRGSWQVLAHHRPRLGDAKDRYLRRQWHLAPQWIAPVVRRSRVGLLVLPRYEPGAPTRVRPLGPGEALQRLYTHVFARPETGMTAAHLRELAAVIEQVPTYELVSGDLDAACRRVLEVLRSVSV